MPLITESIWDWRVLTRAIDERRRPNGFLRNFLFSDFNVNEAQVLEITVYQGDRQMVPFVKRGAAAQKVQGYGEQTRQVRPPMIRNMMSIESYKYLNKVPAGEMGTDAIAPAVLRKINRDLDRLNDFADNAEEFLCGQVLGDATGASKISYTASLGAGEETDVFELTYPRSAANFIDITTAADQWDNATPADPADVLYTAKARLAEVGLVATHCIMGKNVAATFRASSAVKQNLDYRRMTQAGPMPLGGDFDPAGMEGAVYFGEYAALQMWSYERQVQNLKTDGSLATTSDIIDPDSCYVISATPRSQFVMEYGGVEDLVAVQNNAMAQRRFVKAWTQDEPSGAFQLMETHPLPVPYMVDSVVQIQPLS